MKSGSMFELRDHTGQRLATAIVDRVEAGKAFITRHTLDNNCYDNPVIEADDKAWGELLAETARMLARRGRAPVKLPPLLAMELSILTDSDRK